MAGKNEVRFEADEETLAVLDGYATATGKSRTVIINSLLKNWAQNKLREAIMVCRVSGVNPTASGSSPRRPE